ncbi:MAG: UDP-N-acetylglucosamine 2-epimerase (non-hydrolyzing) [Bacilli bacterium]|nr:UDP-N-acetylglucosamine 2-epimerase (non-hydrolyzing) [Bacilli bacterium]
MYKILVVFGTRPEAIKMAPLIKELRTKPDFKVIVCVTAQHREMLDQVLDIFNIVPDYDLNIMSSNQSLIKITTLVLAGIDKIIDEEQPNLVIVHGDTTTTLSTSLATFYNKIKLVHIEAGLRTYNKYFPYPEEINRQITSLLSDYHFAPTNLNKTNLIKEGIKKDNIFVTGNTVIDALKITVKDDYEHKILDELTNKRLILVTVHRRENLGKPMADIFKAIKKITEEYEDILVVFPVHLNPKVREIAHEILNNHSRIKLIEPLSVIDFHNFMAKSYLILTDSGGIQEEAPSLKIPVLVLRNETERKEGLKAGTIKLIGTDYNNVYKSIKNILDNKKEYKKMTKAINPYGDGNASKKIVEIIDEIYSGYKVYNDID